MKTGIYLKILNFDIVCWIFNWWCEQDKTAKMAFKSGLVIGFITHLFLYTNRFFGDHDPGIHFWIVPTRQTGRWFNTFINLLNYGYIMPLMIGVFVTLFLSLAAFYICKIFEIEKKVSAVLIAILLTTFPSIGFTNLFLYDSANYHFGVILATLATYIAIKYKFGFVIAGFLLMFTLAIYQSKISFALGIAQFYLLNELLQVEYKFKPELCISAFTK